MIPLEAQASITRALAALELAVIRIHQHPPRAIPEGTGYSYEGGQSPIDLVMTAILDTVAVIVDVVTTAAGTAADRRQIVTTYCDQLLTQYGTSRLYHVSRLRLDEALRLQPWWTRFQQTLEQAPSLAQQLEAFMREVHWVDDDMAAATQSSPRTVERHRLGKQRFSRRSILAYERALSDKRDRQTLFALPLRSPRTRRTPPGRTRRPKKS